MWATQKSRKSDDTLNYNKKTLMLCMCWNQLGMLDTRLVLPKETITGKYKEQNLMQLSSNIVLVSLFSFEKLLI